jgi:chromosome segregation ATPase
MAQTLEDLDRRVTALEKGAEREKTIERAVAEIVSESEQRVRAEMSKLRAEMSDMGAGMSNLKAEMSDMRAGMSDLKADMSDLRAEVKAESQRLTERVSSSERRMVDILNDRFDQVMAALDRPNKP